MRKTIKSTKPKTKRKYTRKSKLPTERTQRTKPTGFQEHMRTKMADGFPEYMRADISNDTALAAFAYDVKGAFDNVRKDIQNIIYRLEKLERKVAHTEAIAPMVTEMIAKIERELARSRNS